MDIAICYTNRAGQKGTSVNPSLAAGIAESPARWNAAADGILTEMRGLRNFIGSDYHASGSSSSSPSSSSTSVARATDTAAGVDAVSVPTENGSKMDPRNELRIAVKRLYGQAFENEPPRGLVPWSKWDKRGGFSLEGIPADYIPDDPEKKDPKYIKPSHCAEIVKLINNGTVTMRTL